MTRLFFGEYRYNIGTVLLGVMLVLIGVDTFSSLFGICAIVISIIAWELSELSYAEEQ